MSETSSAEAERLGAPDKAWLSELLVELCRIERPSASRGERQAAQWLCEQLQKSGLEPRVEAERAHGTYWWPLGIGAGAGAVAAIAGLRGRRRLATLLGLAATAAVADDFPPAKRRLRRLLRTRETFNVVAELGPSDAEHTIVIGAHHDAAHSGLVFNPAIPETIGEHFPEVFERLDTSPPLIAPMIGAPLLAALGGLTGSRRLLGLAALLGAGSVGAMIDIGTREVVPAANDNGTAVITLIALARRFAEQPTDRLRVILLSTGSEESFSEGMMGFAERHFPSLPVDRTFFLCLEAVGSPHLTVLRGEGFLRMREYPRPALELLDGLAQELGIWLFPNLRLRNGTDGMEALAAGYQSAVLAACTDLKQPANYHWPSDVPENVDFDSVSDAIRLSEAVIRRLDQRWL